MAYGIDVHVGVYKGEQYAEYVRTTELSKDHGCQTQRRVDFYGQLLADLQKDVPLGQD